MGPKGSIFNDIQRNKRPHWHPSSTVPSPRIGEDIKSMRDVVPQQLIDNILLHEDETDTIRYSYDSPLFATNCDINCSQYYYKVFKIVVVACHKMELHGEDSSRYHVCYSNNWGGADTFYHSWLLLNGLRREAFKLEKFKEMCPNWYQLHLSYKKNPHRSQKCNMLIPAYTVIEKTPVDFEITNCDSVVPLVEDSTHDVKHVVKEICCDVIVISSANEQNTSHFHFSYTFLGTEYPPEGNNWTTHARTRTHTRTSINDQWPDDQH